MCQLLTNNRLNYYELLSWQLHQGIEQEWIPVGCVPSAAVVGGGSAWGCLLGMDVYPGGCLNGGCIPACTEAGGVCLGVSSQGEGVCPGVCIPAKGMKFKIVRIVRDGTNLCCAQHAPVIFRNGLDQSLRTFLTWLSRLACKKFNWWARQPKESRNSYHSYTWFVQSMFSDHVKSLLLYPVCFNSL